MKEVTLPSGAKLSIYPAPFAAAKGLFQAIMRELRIIQIDENTDFKFLLKDLFTQGFASEELEKNIWQCLQKCLYNGVRPDADTFEPVEVRQDYLTVCVEVVRENVTPFLKSLLSHYEEFLNLEKTIQKS